LLEGFFFLRKKRINAIFKFTGEKRKKAFESYFEQLKEKIPRKELESHIRFEFLHKNELEGYYKDLFELMLGDKDFLLNLKVKENSDDFEGLLQVEGNAFSFLVEYTDKIRNNITHENEKFYIEGFESFEKVTNVFYFIMEQIVKKYEIHTGFSFNVKDKNILEDFTR